MAHKKGTSSTRNGRGPNTQHPGMKRFGRQIVGVDETIIRQHGTYFHPGGNVGRGDDDTPLTLTVDRVNFGVRRGRHVVNMAPVEA